MVGHKSQSRFLSQNLLHLHTVRMHIIPVHYAIIIMQGNIWLLWYAIYRALDCFDLPNHRATSILIDLESRLRSCIRANEWDVLSVHLVSITTTANSYKGFRTFLVLCTSVLFKKPTLSLSCYSTGSNIYTCMVGPISKCSQPDVVWSVAWIHV